MLTCQISAVPNSNSHSHPHPHSQHQGRHLHPAAGYPSPVNSQLSFFDLLPHTSCTPSPASLYDHNSSLQNPFFQTQPSGSQFQFDSQMDMSSSPPQSYPNPEITVQQPQAMQRLVTANAMPLHQAWGTLNQEVRGNPRPYSFSTAGAPSRRRNRLSHRRGPSSSSSSSPAVSSHPVASYNGYQSPSSTHAMAHKDLPLLQAGSGRRNDSVHEDDLTRFSKHLPTPNHTPTQDSFYSTSLTPTVNTQLQPDLSGVSHLAMKQAVLENNGGTFDDEAPAFTPSGVHSVSSYGQSPATPRTVYGDDMADEKLKGFSNGEDELSFETFFGLVGGSHYEGADVSRHTIPKLDRTMSDVYQDELFNPTCTSLPPAIPTVNNHLLFSPFRNSVNERLSAANEARSQSRPSSAASGVSMFRPTSPLAPKHEGFESAPMMGNAQGTRNQQNSETQARALKRPEEDIECKTISPKDAVLDYQEEPSSTAESKVSLFPDDSTTYESTYGDTDQYEDRMDTGYSNASENTDVLEDQIWEDPSDDNTSSPSFGHAAGQSQHSNFSYVPQPMPASGPRLPFSTKHYRSAPRPRSAHEPTPEFPADLRSMESSASDASIFDSSQGSALDLPKPTSTRADRGTYTCTYHGCIYRFGTPQELQKHKREGHRQYPVSSSKSAPSPTSTTVGDCDISAADLANRNSQAGPHRCDRINLQTGKPCNTIFSRPYDLTRHEDTIHNDQKQKVRCELCQQEKTFSRSDALTRHMRVVHPDVDFPGRHRKRVSRK